MTDDGSFLFLCEKVWGLSEEEKRLSAQAARARLPDDQGGVEDLADRIDLNRVDRRLCMARLLELARPEPPDPGSASVQTAPTLTPPPAAPSQPALKSRSAVVSGRWLEPWTARPLTPSIGTVRVAGRAGHVARISRTQVPALQSGTAFVFREPQAEPRRRSATSGTGKSPGR